MGKFFKNELRYDVKGNITTQVWNNSYFDNTNSAAPYLNHYYKYYYDKLNRLAGADYSEVEYDVNPYEDIEANLNSFPSLLSCGPVVLQNANDFLTTLRVEAGRTNNAFLLSTANLLQSNIAEIESTLASQRRGWDDLTPSELQTYVQEFTQAILLEEEKLATSGVLLDNINRMPHQERTSSTSQAITEVEILNAIKSKIVEAPSTSFNQLIADDYDLIFNDRLSNAEKITRIKVLTAGSNDQLQVVNTSVKQLKVRIVSTCFINTDALAYQTLLVDDRANRTQLNSRKYDVAYWYQKNGNFDRTNRYDELAQRTQINYNYNPLNNQLVTVNWIAPSGNSNSSYSYDAIGNLTADVRSGVNSIAYNQYHNLPTHMAKSNGDRYAYRYSAQGQRSVKKLAEEDVEYYLAGIIVNQDDRPKQYSITDGFATLTNGNALQKSYTVTDWLGSTRLVIDAQGSIENVRDHYPYGLLMNGRNYSSNPEGARFQYTGHQYDGETTFGYHGARYYNRELGRYMSMDPLAAEFASWTPYNYTLGNPINLIDPDGRSPISVLAKQIAKQGVKIGIKKYAKNQIKRRLNRYMSKNMRKQFMKDLDGVLEIVDSEWWEIGLELIPVAGDIYGATSFGIKTAKASDKLQKIENKYVEKIYASLPDSKKKKFKSAMRNAGVRDAKKDQKYGIQNGEMHVGDGTVDGHHKVMVKDDPSRMSDPSNIEFMKKSDHKKLHQRLRNQLDNANVPIIMLKEAKITPKK